MRRASNGRWRVVSPSRYNRRIYGGIHTGGPNESGSIFRVTGPLAGDPRVGATVAGSLANRSGGITPWGTALSCEENFDGVGLPLREGQDFAYGWQVIDPGYDPGAPYRDPQSTTFVWRDYAHGGQTGREQPGRRGFSAADNLAFDSAGNLWVVTDISSGTLNDPGPLEYHANNAMFMIRTKGANAGVAFRFANAPIESELTGPWFTPDESTLFINVQHPGEESGQRGSPAVFGQPDTYSSWWPESAKNEPGRAPGTPQPSLVAITKVRGARRSAAAGENLIPRPV